MIRANGWIPVQSALGISVYTGVAQEEAAGSSGSSWMRGASNPQAPQGHAQAEAAAPVGLFAITSDVLHIW